MRHELAYEVPRAVWDWARDTYDDATCLDIWKIIFLRQYFRKLFLRTAFRAGALLGALSVLGPTYFNGGSQLLGVVTYILTLVLMCYLFIGTVHLRHVAWDARRIYASDWPKWLRIGTVLDPLLKTVRRGDPMVSVMVVFEYPDAT